ncbi:AFR606Cp [Eremothecium gossypii ATCC 10895]|uniref:AFR606Cp n=1 Tax=Eremothecium gossypii (strain ATCC 10895 / CBS 109.51 / FGSC 9923 / NRRL Y-1056) TaxID=284811 RepID=Q752H8_EREGS|nr:AFR606Cp [Eremothecium gossypii ATCC 10895]AAS53977.1 AFR606Cp [Eremothecium gossypii ATCC 10895]AEY98291.1 FAFR606Cp [Eremothecium gossypii FDAG1]
MAEVIDLEKEIGEEHGGARPTEDGETAQVAEGKGRKVQMTFDQFKEVRVTKAGDGLRKSSRVVPKRKAESDEESAAAEEARKRKAAKRAADDEARKRAAKSKASKKQPAKPKAKVPVVKSKAAGKSVSSAAAEEVREPQLGDELWSSCVPLLTADFKNNTPAVSRMKHPHMKPAPFAKDLIVFMNFINKFNQFLPVDLWGVSIQDLQIGLELYPSEQDEQPARLYQDYVAPRDLKHCQDLVNLFFLCLLKLTLNQNSATDMSSLSNGKPFHKLIQQLRGKAYEFGYPPEWRQPAFPGEPKVESARLLPEEVGESKNPEVLTSEVPNWHLRLPLEPRLNPLYSTELEKYGVLSLSPQDRLILLRSLVQWCISYSDKIHGEIYRLSHLKKDPTFGIQTSHAPRHLAHGLTETKQHFKKLCTMLMQKLEIRAQKKHIKKQLESGKQLPLSRKLKTLNELKESMEEYRRAYEAQEGDDRDQEFDPLDVSLNRDYSKWCELLQGEIYDNPMANPYEDDIYKLRNQEFFIGRVPHVGDFYLPRLFTYQNVAKKKDWIPSNYTDPRSLEKLFEDFQGNKHNAVTLFGKNAKMMSLEFKLYYHYTPGMVKDLVTGKPTKDKVYWYEMCHNTETLLDFIKLLEFKLVKETPDDSVSNGPAPRESPKTIPPVPKEYVGWNTNPMPKESKYNKSRAKLQVLKDYLEKMYFFLLRFEQLKTQYGDLLISDRSLRRSQRSRVNYTEEYGPNDRDEYESVEGAPDAEDEEQAEDQEEEEEEEYRDDMDSISDDEDEEHAPGQPRRLRRNRTSTPPVVPESRSARSARRRADKS